MVAAPPVAAEVVAEVGGGRSGVERVARTGRDYGSAQNMTDHEPPLWGRVGPGEGRISCSAPLESAWLHATHPCRSHPSATMPS